MDTNKEIAEGCWGREAATKAFLLCVYEFSVDGLWTVLASLDTPGK